MLIYDCIENYIKFPKNLIFSVLYSKHIFSRVLYSFLISLQTNTRTLKIDLLFSQFSLFLLRNLVIQLSHSLSYSSSQILLVTGWLFANKNDAIESWNEKSLEKWHSFFRLKRRSKARCVVVHIKVLLWGLYIHLESETIY